MNLVRASPIPAFLDGNTCRPTGSKTSDWSDATHSRYIVRPLHQCFPRFFWPITLHLAAPPAPIFLFASFISQIAPKNCGCISPNQSVGIASALSVAPPIISPPPQPQQIPAPQRDPGPALSRMLHSRGELSLGSGDSLTAAGRRSRLGGGIAGLTKLRSTWSSGSKVASLNDYSNRVGNCSWPRFPILVSILCKVTLAG
jgi:hypothetical protein